MSKVANQYDGNDYNYKKYWDGREYEHAAEEIALQRLIGNRHFHNAIDVGGGYGRLAVFLANFSDHVVVAEPALSQHEIAKDFLKDQPKVSAKVTQADALDFADESFDLVTMVRVMHHIPEPTTEFAEINRVMMKGGLFILEVANNAHFVNRLRYLSKGKGVPTQPVDIRSADNQRDDAPAFVNHHPKTVIAQLEAAGFTLVDELSVSNLRSGALKKRVPAGTMLKVEKALQKPLAKVTFGPSMFLALVKN